MRIVYNFWSNPIIHTHPTPQDQEAPIQTVPEADVQPCSRHEWCSPPETTWGRQQENRKLPPENHAAISRMDLHSGFHRVSPSPFENWSHCWAVQQSDYIRICHSHHPWLSCLDRATGRNRFISSSCYRSFFHFISFHFFLSHGALRYTVDSFKSLPIFLGDTGTRWTIVGPTQGASCRTDHRCPIGRCRGSD